MISYNTEKAMSRDFEKYLKSNIGNTFYKELEGLFGRPDYVYFVKHKDNILIISFELKLSDWRHAMIQAFRYKSFSNLSYVVMPEGSTNKASIHIEEFKKYGIGLLSFGESGLKLICSSNLSEPFSPQLNEKVINKAKKSRKKSFALLTDIICKEH